MNYDKSILKYPEDYKKLEVEKLGLDKIGVLIEDQSPISDYFNVKELPDEISNGKYAFVIDPSPDILKLGSQIKIELLDSDGNPLPILYPKSPETLTSYGDGEFAFEENRNSDGYSLNTITGRNVQIVVYDEVPHGIATLSIVGEAKSDIYTNSDIPKDWKGVYNVRWTKKILINKSQFSLNKAQILFYNTPNAELYEITSSYKQLVGSASTYYTDTSSANLVSLESYEKSVRRRDDDEDVRATTKEKTYYLKASGFSFEQKHVGASILVNVPVSVNINNSFGEPSLASRKLDSATHVVTPPTVPDSGANLFAYRTTIKSIVNSTTAIVEPYAKRFQLDDVIYDVNYYTFGASAVTMSYYLPDTRAVHTKVNSYVNLKLKNLKTLSGQVGKIKVFYKSSGEFGDYKLLTEKKVSNQTLLVDTNGFDLGTFPSSVQNLNTIFETSSLTYTGASVATNASNELKLEFGSDHVFNSLRLVASSSLLSDQTNFYKITHKKLIDFDSDSIYTVSFDLIGQNQDVTTKPYIEVYMSGSSFVENNTDGLQNDINKLGKQTSNEFGKFVSRKQLYGNDIQVSDADLKVGDFVDYKTVNYQFKPNFDGTGQLVFIIKGQANWIINNIEIGTKLQKGFSPSSYNLLIPQPSTKLNDAMDFKVEFYNPEEVRATQYFETTQSINFYGNNVVIERQNNLLTGSLYIGNAIGSGIEMAGVTSAFIRSIGYEGFYSSSINAGSGFMMYSGSVLPGSGDNYNGVGLELYADSSSYMRFRTDPSELDIRASVFFVGNPSGSYIFGSGSIIEISSSNFFVSSSGNVYISGTIEAIAGHIGGFTITTASLSSANIFISGSPLAGGVNDPRYMFISTSNFNVKQNGDITGSQVLFTGGKISSFLFTSISFETDINRGKVELTPKSETYTFNLYRTGSGDQRVGIDADGIRWDATQIIASPSQLTSISIISGNVIGSYSGGFEFWILYNGISWSVVYDDPYQDEDVAHLYANWDEKKEKIDSITVLNAGNFNSTVSNQTAYLDGTPFYQSDAAEIQYTVSSVTGNATNYVSIMSMYADYTGVKYFYGQRGSDTYIKLIENNSNKDIVITPGSTGLVQLRGYGLEFGPNSASTDTNLYRSASNVLKTDDNFHVVEALRTSKQLELKPMQTAFSPEANTSYIYVSGSSPEMWFTENNQVYTTTVNLHTLTENSYTGLQYGGILSSASSTTFNISSGSGVIVNLNATTGSEPETTFTYVKWNGFTNQSLTYRTTHIQTFIGIDSSGNIIQQTTPWSDGEFNTSIQLGTVIHQNKSTINATINYPNVAYGYKQRTYDFIKAFGPLKLSGFVVAPSSSYDEIALVTIISTGSLVVGSGTAFADGRNYQIDPNNPSYISDPGTTVSKIFRYYQSGSQGDFSRDTNGGLGYGAIDSGYYNNNGTLTPLSNNNKWSTQRVFWYPNSATKGIVVYYGNVEYDTKVEAIANIPYEQFSEDVNTQQNAIFLAHLVVKANADFSDDTTYQILPAGIFRSVGGTGGGGSTVTNRLIDLSDVQISSPTERQALVYDSTLLKWINGTPVQASTASYVNPLNQTVVLNGTPGNPSWIQFYSGSTVHTQIIDDGTEFRIQGRNNDRQGMSFWTNDVRALFISSSNQYIGINKTSPNAQLDVNGNAIISGNLVVQNNLTVLGSSSIQYITQSQLIVEDNIITVNGFSPFVRYAGLEAVDSGSEITASLLWDGTNDYWFMMSSSKQTSRLVGTTFGNLGSETSLTSNYVPKATGTNTIADSTIQDSGTSIILGSPVTASIVSASTNIITNNFTSSGLFQINGVGTNTIGGNLAVGSNISYGNRLYVNGNTLIDGNINISGVGNNVIQGNTLFDDSVLIGSSVFAPNARLHITGSTTNENLLLVENSSGTDILFVSSSGNVSIGKSIPNSTFDVNGNSIITGSLTVTLPITASIVSASTSIITNQITASIVSASSTLIAGTTTIKGSSTFSGSITLKDGVSISFTDQRGTYPTDVNSAFKWTLNNDSATIYAQQPSSDSIDFVFKITDNTDSNDRYIFWIDDYRGATFDAYPLWIDATKMVVNYLQHYNTGTSNNTDFYILPSGSSTITTPLVHADVSANSFGIGKQNPTATLDISGSVSISGSTSAYNVAIRPSNDYDLSAGTALPTLKLRAFAPSLMFDDSSPNASGSTIFANNNKLFIRKESGTYSATDAYQTIDLHTGNVGIGTTSPTAKLHVSGTTASETLLHVQNSTGLNSLFISSSNQVCIGTTTPSSNYILTVNGVGSLSTVIGGTVFTNTFRASSNTVTNFYPNSGTSNLLLALGWTSQSVAIGKTPDKSGSIAVLDVNGNTIITGSLTVTGSINIANSMREVDSVTSTVGSNTIFSNSTGSFSSAFIKYTIASASNARSGQIMSVWNGTSIDWAETTTNDIGNTNAVSMSMAIASSNVVLSFYTPTATWRIKAITDFI